MLCWLPLSPYISAFRTKIPFALCSRLCWHNLIWQHINIPFCFLTWLLFFFSPKTRLSDGTEKQQQLQNNNNKKREQWNWTRWPRWGKSMELPRAHKRAKKRHGMACDWDANIELSTHTWHFVICSIEFHRKQKFTHAQCRRSSFWLTFVELNFNTYFSCMCKAVV